MKPDNKLTLYYCIVILLLVIIIMMTACNPPQSTQLTPPVTISKSDTVVSVYSISDTGAWRRLTEVSAIYDIGDDFGQGIMEITIHDTVNSIVHDKADCPTFPKLRKNRGNIIINSVVDTGAILAGKKVNIKPQTNNGYSPKQLILPALASWLFIFLIGFGTGFFTGKKK